LPFIAAVVGIPLGSPVLQPPAISAVIFLTVGKKRNSKAVRRLREVTILIRNALPGRFRAEGFQEVVLASSLTTLKRIGEGIPLVMRYTRNG